METEPVDEAALRKARELVRYRVECVVNPTTDSSSLVDVDASLFKAAEAVLICESRLLDVQHERLEGDLERLQEKLIASLIAEQRCLWYTHNLIEENRRLESAESTLRNLTLRLAGSWHAFPRLAEAAARRPTSWIEKCSEPSAISNARMALVQRIVASQTSGIDENILIRDSSRRAQALVQLNLVEDDVARQTDCVIRESEALQAHRRLEASTESEIDSLRKDIEAEHRVWFERRTKVAAVYRRLSGRQGRGLNQESYSSILNAIRRELRSGTLATLIQCCNYDFEELRDR